jgi:carbonic anhydrase
MAKIKRLLPVIVFITFISVAAGVSAQNADEAVKLLKEGNARFAAMEMWHPDLNATRRQTVAAQPQKPFAAVLGCSDSRVPVELIFDRGIGNIFVIRVAGNVVIGPAVIGSAEYAAEHLGVPVLVVMGHTGCGAGQAAISAAPIDGSMRDITDKIQTVVERVKSEHPEMEGVALENAVIKANVLEGKRDLLSASEELRELTGEGKLRVLTAVYDMKTGVVEWIDD